MFVYLIPIALHVKCVYFPRSFPLKEGAEQEMEGKDKSDKEEEEGGKSEEEGGKSELGLEVECKCDIEFSSKCQERCEMVLLVLMGVSGLAVMFYTIVLVAHDSL